jgi:hypothetical protein
MANDKGETAAADRLSGFITGPQTSACAQPFHHAASGIST